jgi:DNA-binding NarL/FixJ family response regulator
MNTLFQAPAFNRSIRLAIVDDHPCYRQKLRALLNANSELQLVGDFATGEAALRKLPYLRPEVVIMDLNISRSMDGVACTRELRKHLPGVQVLINSAVTDRFRVVAALRAGAVGYILKDEPSTVLLSSIVQAAAGGAPMSDTIARTVVESFQSQDVEQASNINLLTSREMEVLTATSQGAKNKDLAITLGVSHETIRNHLRHIFGKLQVNSRTEAAALFWAQHSASRNLQRAA